MQNEIAMVKMQMGIMEKDYKRRISVLEDRNIELTLQLEETRRNAEQRVDSLYKEMKQSAISTNSEPIIRYEYVKTPQMSAIKSNINYGLTQQSQIQTNRQLENLNLVLETKMQEIKALEERLLLQKQQHQQQTDQLTQHYENILKTKVKNELAALSVQHEKQISQLQIDIFNLQYKLKATEERNRKILDDKQKLIQELQDRIVELENNDQTNQIRQFKEENIKLREEYNLIKQDFKAELELLNNKHQSDLQMAFQQGYEQADSNNNTQIELQKMNGQLKQANDKSLKLDAENRQLNILLQTYQQEIQEWKDKYQTTILRQKDEIEKLRQSFERQKKDQFDLTSNAEYLQEKNRFVFQIEQQTRQIQQLQQQNEKYEKELKSILNEQYNTSQLQNEIQQLRRQLELSQTEYENYKKKYTKIEKQQQDEILRLNQDIKNTKSNLANSADDKYKALQEKQSEIDQLNLKIYEMEQSNRSFSIEIERLKKEIKQQKLSYQQQVDKLSDEINQLNEKISLLSMERYNFEQQLSKQKNLKDQLENLQKNLLQQNEIIEQLTQELDEERNNNQILLNNEQQYKSQIQKLSNRIRELESENDQLNQDLYSSQEQLQQYEQEFVNFDVERKKKQQQYENLEKKLKSVVEELQMKEDEFNEQSQNHYNDLELQKQQYIKQFEQQKRDLSRLTNAVQDSEIQNQQLQDQLLKSESENSRLKNQVQSLQNENRQMETQIRNQQISFKNVADKLTDQEMQRPSLLERSSQFNY